MARRVVYVVLALVALAGLVAGVMRFRARPDAPRVVVAPEVPGPPAAAGPIGTASPSVPAEAVGQGASRVEGSVRDALTGAPVAGVDVVFAAGGAEATTTSDRAGHFGVDLAPGRYLVRAAGDGVFGLSPAPLALGAGARVTSYDLVVARLATVRGRVVDAEGQAAAGAQVSFTTQTPAGRLGSADLEAAGIAGSAESGADGGFELRVVPGALTLAAARAGRRARLLLPQVSPGQELAGAELVLDAGGGVAGIVRDPSGRPVAGALVVALNQDGPAGLHTSTRGKSGADGRFALPEVPAGKVRIEARARGFAPSAPLFASSSAEPASRELVLELRPALALRGRVLGPDGSPVAGAQVVARQPGEIFESPSTRSSEDGSFTIGDLDPGPHDLSADLQGFGSALRRRVGAPAEGIELRLQGFGGLAGVVTQANGPKVVDFHVRWTSVLLAQDVPGRSGENRFLAADGAFRLDGLTPGSYDVTVSAPGQAPAERRVEVVAGQYADASVRLERGATLSGRVVSAAGGAIAGAHVEVMTGHEGDAILTDADGRFVLEDVAPGRRSLVVGHPAFVTRHESGLELSAGGRSSVDVVLTPLGAGSAATPGAHPAELVGIGAALTIVRDGVVVADVLPGGPAERAGILKGDLLISVSGRPLAGRTLGDITEDIRGVAGTAVRLEIRRGEQTRVLDVVRGTVRFGG